MIYKSESEIDANLKINTCVFCKEKEPYIVRFNFDEIPTYPSRQAAIDDGWKNGEDEEETEIWVCPDCWERGIYVPQVTGTIYFE